MNNAGVIGKFAEAPLLGEAALQEELGGKTNQRATNAYRRSNENWNQLAHQSTCASSIRSVFSWKGSDAG
jgi:hypothetical protein